MPELYLWRKYWEVMEILMHRYLVDIVTNILNKSKPYPVEPTPDGFRITIEKWHVDVTRDELRAIYPELDADTKTRLMAMLLGSRVES